tara:strand:- start:10 stop:117 length:108 start_codon:yes stop_codon:yes gene_type:complete
MSYFYGLHLSLIFIKEVWLVFVAEYRLLALDWLAL